MKKTAVLLILLLLTILLGCILVFNSNQSTGISKEASLEIAKKAAEDYMHKRSPDHSAEYIMQENLAKGECRYDHVLDREVWEWELKYWYKGIDLSDEKAVMANEDNPDYSIPDYSCTVSVDKETGEVLQMGTNWQ